MSHPASLCPALPADLCPAAQAAGYGKVVSHVIIGLKTVKGTKQLKLDPTIYDSLQKERVQVHVSWLKPPSGPSLP
jgi:hypothetical protein